jgi:hypothetical protein
MGEVTDINAKGTKEKEQDSVTSKGTGREVVRRNELTGIIKQVVDNVNEMAKHLMNDVNTLFKRFVYPIMMRTNAIENLLIMRNVLTKEEINEEAKRLTEEAIAKAKEINEDGKFKESSGASSEGIKAEEVAKIEKVTLEENKEKIVYTKPEVLNGNPEEIKEKKVYTNPEIRDATPEEIVEINKALEINTTTESVETTEEDK